MAEEKKEKIKAEELRVEKIGDIHLEILKSFQSYEPELVDFLQEDALNQQKRKISVTYLWFKRDTHELVSYITLSPDCVKLKKISIPLAQKFREKGINYKSLPALKIGRLCVSDNFLGRGIGTLMIQFAVKIAKEISGLAGCRFLYLDAKRNPDPKKNVIHFYKKLGFELYKERDNKETPMYMDLWSLLSELADK